MWERNGLRSVQGRKWERRTTLKFMRKPCSSPWDMLENGTDSPYRRLHSLPGEFNGAGGCSLSLSEDAGGPIPGAPQASAALPTAVCEAHDGIKTPPLSFGRDGEGGDRDGKIRYLLQQQDSPALARLRRAFRIRLKSVPSRMKPPAIIAISLMTRRPAPDR